MQSTDWPAAHCEALREYLALGMSYSGIAKAINAKFETAYSRSAAIGRARRMGLSGRPRLGDTRRQRSELPRGAKQTLLRESRQRHVPESGQPAADFKRAKMPKLRSVEITPRHLSLVDLEAADCRYPYGGDEDGEAITFCGHPRRPGSSYCAPHFHLTLGPGTWSERTAVAVMLRIVKAA
jgi:GcrA cell cycle regulator